MPILTSGWLDSKLVLNKFEQSTILNDLDSEKARDGFCTTAALYWIKQCMKKDRTGIKGLQKYGDALERLRLKVQKVIDRHDQTAVDRAVVNAEIRKIAQVSQRLSEAALGRSQNWEAEVESITMKRKKGALNAADEQLFKSLVIKADDLERQAKADELEIQTLKMEYLERFRDAFSDVGGDVKVLAIYTRIAEEYRLKLHSGVGGQRNASLGSDVCSNIPPNTYFLYWLSKDRQNVEGHVLGGYRSDGAGFFIFDGTSYLTVFDPNMGIFRGDFHQEGPRLFNELHNAYVTDGKANEFSFPFWDLARVSYA
jgi:hypothetical protein